MASKSAETECVFAVQELGQAAQGLSCQFNAVALHGARAVHQYFDVQGADNWTGNAWTKAGQCGGVALPGLAVWARHCKALALKVLQHQDKVPVQPCLAFKADTHAVVCDLLRDGVRGAADLSTRHGTHDVQFERERVFDQ